jgi:hypothetical protein
MKVLKLGCLFVLALVLSSGIAGVAKAQTVILEGSDAIGFHCQQEAEAGACVYTAQAWKALDGSSGKPIAVIGDVPGISSQGSGVTIDDFVSVAAAGTLSQYAALYFVATGGCCTENDSLITAAGAQAAVTSYLTGDKGTVMIENYIGGSAWDFAVGAGGLGNADGNSKGYGTAAGGFSCTDGETVTATGLTNGFTQPPPISCWEHQAYNTAFFSGLTSINGSGFSLSFFNADATQAPGYSALLSDGVTLTGGGPSVPEPSSLVLLMASLVALLPLKKLLARA